MAEHAPHPDYAAVPEAARWARPLGDLLGVLKKEAWAAHGRWCWRMLPHGALVSVRIMDEGQGVAAYSTQLRIARKAPLDTDDKRKRWGQELEVFLKHFGMGWQRQSGAEDPTKADVTYVALLGPTQIPVEKAAASTAVCADCGKPCEPGPYKPNRCTDCAIKAGAKGP